MAGGQGALSLIAADAALKHPVSQQWEGYCSAAELAFTVPGIERVGIHHDKASQASADVPRSSGCRPIGEQPDTPSVLAGPGTGCTWRITRGEWLSAR